MIASYCELFGFPKEATEVLSKTWAELSVRFDASARFGVIREAFLQEGNTEYRPMLRAFAEESGINRRVLDMIFLLWCAPALRAEYKARGISDQIFVDTLSDLRCKLLECYANQGVWGTFVTFWYPGFYRCERFALGRLQFEKRPFKYPEYATLREGDTVLNCHIPSSGPLTPELVMSSLRRAYDFYKDVQKDGILPVACHSWLLYPPHYPLFGPNTKKFQDLFSIVKQEEDTANDDFWRIYNMPFSEEALATAPEDTTLRRRFKEFLSAGSKMGSGYGVLLFDGERVVKP